MRWGFPVHPRWREVSYLGLHENDLPPLTAPFYASVGTCMHFNRGRIYAEIFYIRITTECEENIFQSSVITPLAETGIDSLPLPVIFRQFTPLATAVGNPQHPVQHRSITLSGTTLLPCLLWWKQWFYSFPCFICQFISSHTFSLLNFLHLGNFYFTNKP